MESSRLDLSNEMYERRPVLEKKQKKQQKTKKSYYPRFCFTPRTGI